VPPCITVECIVLFVDIQDIPASNLGLERSASLTLHGFTQSFLASARI
jgi:hypothetical protein